MILYRYSKEKFCLGHSWELKGQINPLIEKAWGPTDYVKTMVWVRPCVNNWPYWFIMMEKKESQLLSRIMLFKKFKAPSFQYVCRLHWVKISLGYWLISSQISDATTLSWSTRIKGFIICFIIGVSFSFLVSFEFAEC